MRQALGRTTFSGSIDPQALSSAGWIVPNGNFPNFFQKDTLYGVVSLDTSNQTLTYSLNLVAPSVEALRLWHRQYPSHSGSWREHTVR
jgi:hypothetical protein